MARERHQKTPAVLPSQPHLAPSIFIAALVGLCTIFPCLLMSSRLDDQLRQFRPLSSGIFLYPFHSVLPEDSRSNMGQLLSHHASFCCGACHPSMAHLLSCTMHQPFILLGHDMTTGAAGCNPHSCCLRLEMPATSMVGVEPVPCLALQTGRISVRICIHGIGTTAAGSDTTPDIAADRPS